MARGVRFSAAIRDCSGPKDRLRELAKAKPEDYKAVKSCNSLLAVGIVNAVEGVPRSRIEPFIQAAMNNVRQGPTNVHQNTWIALNEVAETYDFFHDAIPAAERRAMVDWFNAHLERYTDDENAFHNSTLSKILVYLRIAYATRDENPRAGEFRDYAIKKALRRPGTPRVAALRRRRRLYRGWLVYPRIALEPGRRAGTGAAIWRATMVSRKPPDSSTSGWPTKCFSLIRRRASSATNSSRSRATARTSMAAIANIRARCGRSWPNTSAARRWPVTCRTSAAGHPIPRPERLISCTKRNRNRRAILSGFPLAHCAADIGKVYARSDWRADATWLRFDCGPFWTNHQHYEAGNFEIFRYEPLATESGEYVSYSSSHDVNWLIRTIAHNCILVYEPGESWKNLRDGDRNQHANDGGQTNAWDWPVATLADWDKRREKFERAKLVAYENQPGYMFVAGDCTKAYAPSKLSLCLRQIVFLRPSTVVVFDRVVSTRPDYEKTWLLHMKNEPQIEGNRVTIAAGKGRLICQTLLPEDPTIRKVFGYTYRGSTFDAQQSVLTASAAKWRVEVLPSQAAKEDLFLHVLFTDMPQPTRLVRDGDDVGVRIGRTEVIFTGQVGGRLKLDGQEHVLTPQMKLGIYER